MFVADVLTTWVEAFKALFDEEYPVEELRGIPVHTDYPLSQTDYPGLWVNYSMQGEMKNVGIGHEEFIRDASGWRRVYRWHFGGLVEVTIGAMGNLERALLIDEITKAIAISRIDENPEGVLRETVERSDLVGQIVTWESINLGAFGEAQGTPWGTDDVIYEATLSLVTSGEVVLDPQTSALVPLSSVITKALLEGDPDLPVPGQNGWT